MSNSMKWIIGIVVVVLIALGVWWWWGNSNTSTPSSQPAAAATVTRPSTTSTTVSPNSAADASIGTNAQAINAQIHAMSTTIASLNAQSSATTVSGAVASMNQLVGAIAQLKAQVQARVATAKGVTTNTLNTALQGASSQYLLASSADAKATSALQTPTATNVRQAESQLAAGFTAAKSAFASITSVATAVAGR
ncbi:MAG: hypothetical protein P4L81_05820 [Candidatus Pacebacteria bacterium]|nr:hypothetical protein [Candidatus Paceibacterota bacterium]